jgi:3-deoxy-D-manno-octulosonic-acid transferase
LAGLCRRVFFAPVQRFGVQTERDRQRLIASGAPGERLQVTGNLKFDSPLPEPKAALEAMLTTVATGRAVMVAGSTMPGEDAIIIDAFTAVAVERALLILAPRHPERAAAVLQQVRQRGLRCALRSTLPAEPTATTTTPKTTEPEDLTSLEVIVLDTLGELASLYRLADIAFIGGTLVPTGGHNPLEPAHFAKPIVVGPAMDNFRDMAEQFDDADAWRRAADGDELARIITDWLDDPATARDFGQRAQQLLVANRGAVDRTLRWIRPLFDL